MELINLCNDSLCYQNPSLCGCGL